MMVSRVLAKSVALELGWPAITRPAPTIAVIGIGAVVAVIDGRAIGWRRAVIVDFLVDTEGDVQNAYAIKSSQREFESAALQSVNKWKFEAGQKGGLRVNAHLQVPVVFTLSEDDAPDPPAAVPADGKSSEAAPLVIRP